MQLRNARLCLDCEEIHDAAQCPSCACETFAFITRWVPAPERRAKPRPVEPESAEALTTYRRMLDEEHTPTRTERASASIAEAFGATAPNSNGWRLVKGGALGLALVGVAGWMWKRSAQPAADAPAENDPRSAHG